LGVYIKPVEHKIYRSIARACKQRMVVAKGYNVQDLGEEIYKLWTASDDLVFIGLDAHRFDMHVTKEMLEWEHSIYKGLYRGDKKLKELLSWQLYTRAKGYCEDGSVKYTVSGRRCSGDMNTGLGNCIIMCAILFAYRDVMGLNYTFINNGDDCGVFIKRGDVAKFESRIDDFCTLCGFRIGCETPVRHIEQIRFCQMAPVNVNGKWVMVREVDNAREKDSISITKLHTPRMLKQWLYAVGECGLALCSGVPILQSMYMCYMRNGIKSKMDSAVYMECGSRNLSVGMVSKESTIIPETRASFYSAFDYTAEEQMDLERYYSRLIIEHGNEVTELSDVAPLGKF
jgi:hypothetical protein